jgi:TRAP-type C4-dicarboxylate transport system substrate-binding protein
MAFSLILGVSTELPSAQAQSNPKQKILKFVSYVDKTQKPMIPSLRLIDILNKKAKGEFIIRHAGGPEAIPAFDQLEAVRTGVVDIRVAPGGYDTKAVPETGAMFLSQLNPMEERQRGVYDILAEAYKKRANAMYLGRQLPFVPFYILLRVRVEKLDDLKGVKTRTASLYDSFIREIGAVGVSMPTGEIYTAMERGVIDAFPANAVALMERGYPEVTKYIIVHGWNQADHNMLMNLDTWNSLPKHHQKLIMDTVIEQEPWALKWAKEFAANRVKALLDYGVKPIEFSPADAKKYVKAAQAGWKKLITKLPETGPKLRKLATK